ncbi:MAG: hypothetical protein R6X11_01225, partial [Desulfonatronovibrio sp.]
FKLTDQQVEEFLTVYPEAKDFDTEERSLFADYISEVVTGKQFPICKFSLLQLGGTPLTPETGVQTPLGTPS